MGDIRRIATVILTLCFVLSDVCQVGAGQGNQGKKERCNVVIFVQFNGDEESDVFNTEKQGVSIFERKGYECYDKILNGRDTPNTSLASYIEKVSGGKQTVDNYAPQYHEQDQRIVPVTLDREASYYKQKEDTMVREAVKKAKINDSHPVDRDGDGFVDNVMFFVNYPYVSDKTTAFYPHKTNLAYDTSSQVKINEKDIGSYVVINRGNLWTGLAEAGLVTHEYLHTLGLPDLYRNTGKGESENPVGVWDIMASNSSFMQYPLAWQRKQLGWTEIAQINESGTYTLNPVGTEGENSSYIISSPLSETEFFVVEYRKKGEDINGLEYKIPGSGLVIYRVDTKKTTNAAGEDYLYVFRDKDAADNRLMPGSYLSMEDKRTSFGTEDMSKGRKDNALTFSDGSNSGIVIDQVGSAGDTISFQVKLPQIEKDSLWKRILTESEIYQYDITADRSGNLYIAQGDGRSSCVKKWTGSQWQQMGSKVAGLINPKLVVSEDSVYLSGCEGTSLKIKLLKYESGTWNPIWTSSENSNGSVALAEDGDRFYAMYDVEGMGYRIVKVQNDHVEDYGKAISGLKLAAAPKITVFQGQPVIAFMDVGEKGKTLRVGQLKDQDWSMETFRVPEKENSYGYSYDLCTVGNKMYFVAEAGLDMILYKNQGLGWEKEVTDMQSVESGISLGSIQGNISMGRLEDGQNGLRIYTLKDARWMPVGHRVSGDVSEASCKIISYGNKVYTAVLCSNGLGVFEKELDKESGGTEESETSQTTTSQTTAMVQTDPKNDQKKKPEIVQKPMTVQKVTGHIFKVSWKKKKGRNGYVVSCKTGKKGKYKKIKTVSNVSGTKLLLKSGKSYSFKVKGYRIKKGKRKYDGFVKAKGKQGKRAVQVTYRNLSGYQGYYLYMKEGKGKYRCVKKSGNKSILLYKKEGIKKGKSYQFCLKGYQWKNGKRVFTLLNPRKA